MEGIYASPKASLLIYTRCPDQERYPEGLAHSIHFAWSREGKTFQPLNQNYGILFAKANIDGDNTIKAKGIQNPWLFYMAGGTYGIVAVKVNEGENVNRENLVEVLFWSTRDFAEFHENPPLKLRTGSGIRRITCRYLMAEKYYEICWDIDGGKYRGTVKNLNGCHEITNIQPVKEMEKPACAYGPEGAVAGNVIEIESSLCSRIVRRWNPIKNTEILVPQRIWASSAGDMDHVKATAVYSDGSSVSKCINWNLEKVDFHRPGEYPVSGIVTDRVYPFPLAKGFADPVIFRWEGIYYFIATDDNLNDIGLYVREAKNPEDLFKEGIEQHLILAYDEKRNFIQTFWAPELHEIGGELYIFFTVSGRTWEPQCHLMKLKKGGNLLQADDWEEPIRIKRKDGSWLAETGITLDMTYLEAGAASYVIWSYRKNIGTKLDTGSMLYIAPIDKKAPWRLAGDPVMLSRPLFSWENVKGTINNEGPFAFVFGDTVYVTYSGGAANGYTYALGLLTGKTGDDLLNPDNWKKSGAPVLTFYSVKGEYGPGHNSFFTDPEGNLMIAYHAEDAITHHVRCTGIRRVHFNIDGKPVFDMSAERDLTPGFREVYATVIVE